MLHTPVKDEARAPQRQSVRKREQSPDSRRRPAVFPEPSPGRMSYEEFLEWADEDTLAEWIDGEVIMSGPASLPHPLEALREIAEIDSQEIARFVGLLQGDTDIRT